MADTTGQADIRGIDVDGIAKGYSEEFPSPMKSFFGTVSTKSREMRWWQKTAGFIDTADTSGMTASRIQSDELGMPEVAQQTMTRLTSYVRVFKLASQSISAEDKRDSDPDIYGAHVVDITRAVMRAVEQRVYDVAGEAATSGTPNPTTVPTAGAVADGWNDVATGDPITDVNAGIESLRSYSWNIDNITIFMNQAEEKWLKNYIINVKGSSISGYSSDQVTKSKMMDFLGCRISVSPLFTTDWVLMATPDMVKWRSFSPLNAKEVYEEITDTYRIVVKEVGEAVLQNPTAGYWISDTIV